MVWFRLAVDDQLSRTTLVNRTLVEIKAYGTDRGQLERAIWMMSPFFLLFSLINGMVNGLAADFLIESLPKYPAFIRLPDILGRPTTETLVAHECSSVKLIRRET